MEKLIERESATRNPLSAAPALAVQFFLIPMAVVGVTVLVYAGFRSLIAVVPRLQPLYESADPGIRKMAVYALGALPGDAQLPTLRTALQDTAPDVRWNAAVALSRHGNQEAVPVIGQMLDRPFVEQSVNRDVRQDEDRDPVGDVMISGLRAAAALKADRLRARIETLSRQD